MDKLKEFHECEITILHEYICSCGHIWQDTINLTDEYEDIQLMLKIIPPKNNKCPKCFSEKRVKFNEKYSKLINSSIIKYSNYISIESINSTKKEGWLTNKNYIGKKDVHGYNFVMIFNITCFNCQHVWSNKNSSENIMFKIFQTCEKCNFNGKIVLSNNLKKKIRKLSKYRFGTTTKGISKSASLGYGGTLDLFIG